MPIKIKHELRGTLSGDHARLCTVQAGGHHRGSAAFKRSSGKPNSVAVPVRRLLMKNHLVRYRLNFFAPYIEQAMKKRFVSATVCTCYAVHSDESGCPTRT